MAAEWLPRAQGPFLNADGTPAAEWYDFLRALAEALDTATSDAARIAILEEAVAALQQGGASVQIVGPASIRVLGSSGDGYTLTLDGDDAAPAAGTVYASNGTKGWRAFADFLAAGDGIELDTDADTGVTTISASSAATPYFIPADTTFRVPQYTQALFSMPIDCEGFLDVEGYLIGVD